MLCLCFEKSPQKHVPCDPLFDCLFRYCLFISTDITCIKHETDELVEYLSRPMERLRCGQLAGMTTNIFSLEAVGCVDSQPDCCVDSQPDCSGMVNREPPSPVDPMVRPAVTFFAKCSVCFAVRSSRNTTRQKVAPSMILKNNITRHLGALKDLTK